MQGVRGTLAVIPHKGLISYGNGGESAPESYCVKSKAALRAAVASVFVGSLVGPIKGVIAGLIAFFVIGVGVAGSCMGAAFFGATAQRAREGRGISVTDFFVSAAMFVTAIPYAIAAGALAMVAVFIAMNFGVGINFQEEKLSLSFSPANVGCPLFGLGVLVQIFAKWCGQPKTQKQALLPESRRSRDASNQPLGGCDMYGVPDGSMRSRGPLF